MFEPVSLKTELKLQPLDRSTVVSVFFQITMREHEEEWHVMS